MKFNFDTDSDGYISQECPVCYKRFKVNFKKGSNKPLSFCPYCNYNGQNCWFTQPQIEYIKNVVAKEYISPELKKITQDFNRKTSKGSPISSSMKYKPGSSPIIPKEPQEDWPQLLFECCGETIKHDQSMETLHCVICGREIKI